MSSAPTPDALGLLDSSGRVAANAPCVHCGYNLRTLAADGVCPECGQPVRHSLHGNFLSFASPVWLKSVARGLMLILIALGLGVLAGPLLILLVSLSYFATGAAGMGPMPAMARPMSVMPWLAFLPALVIGIAGVSLFTRRDPGLGDQPEGFTARRVARVCAFLLPLPFAARIVMGFLAAHWLSITVGPTIFATGGFWFYLVCSAIGMLLGFAIFTVTPLALLRHLRRLLLRIPRPGLARFATVEFWGLAVCATVACLGYLATLLIMLPAMRSWMATVPAVTSLPASGPVLATPAAGSRFSYRTSARSGGTTIVTTTTPAGAPLTTPSAGPPPGFMAAMTIGGCTGGAGACGTLGFGIAGVVLLIMACRTMFHEAQVAARNVEMPVGPVPPSAAPPAAGAQPDAGDGLQKGGAA